MGASTIFRCRVSADGQLTRSLKDLYLLHDASAGFTKRLEAWRVLEAKVASGELRSIGVSNFVRSFRVTGLSHTNWNLSKE